MIPVSRKRGYSAATSVDTAVGEDQQQQRAAAAGRSHDHIGSTPAASRNANTTTRFRPRLKTAVSTTASGITSRGNCVLRTTDSWLTIELTACVVASWKNEKSTMLNSSSTGYCTTRSPRSKACVKTVSSTPNSSSGRPSDHRYPSAVPR